MAIVEEARKSRALLAFAMLRHAPKHNVAKFYSGDAMTAAMKLHAMGKPLTPGGVMDRAVTKGATLVRAEVINMIKGHVGCLTVDEATTKMLGRKRPMAVVFGCIHLGKPILLKVVFQGTTAEAAAIATREACVLYGINLITQITCEAAAAPRLCPSLRGCWACRTSSAFATSGTSCSTFSPPRSSYLALLRATSVAC